MADFGSKQCLLCQMWHHYEQDWPVCRSCYHKFKLMEIYDIQNKLFEWGEEE